jgi:hypothetical protein
VQLRKESLDNRCGCCRNVQGSMADKASGESTEGEPGKEGDATVPTRNIIEKPGKSNKNETEAIYELDE